MSKLTVILIWLAVPFIVDSMVTGYDTQATHHAVPDMETETARSSEEMAEGESRSVCKTTVSFCLPVAARLQRLHALVFCTGLCACFRAAMPFSQHALGWSMPLLT